LSIVKHVLMVSLIAMFGIIPLRVSAQGAEIEDLDSVDFNPVVIEAFIDGYAKQSMLKEQSLAGVIAIVHRGELMINKGYGYQSLEPRTVVEANKTVFRLASISKMFTWVAVMQQVERGTLDLDEDVNKYLTTFQIEDTWPGQPVTLRHIMTHTAGFEASSIWHMVASRPDELMPLAQFMKKLQPYRINPPGTEVAYSNYATALAGLIVSNVSGQKYDEYIQQNIFDVLGMESSSFDEPLPEELTANVVDTYKIKSADIVASPPNNVSNMAPAAGLVGTSADMIIFAQAILNRGEYGGKRILSPASVDQMLSTQYRHDARITGAGLGFLETQANGNLLYGHGADMPSFHSELIIDKANDLAYFVSFAGGGAASLRTNFKPAFYNKFFPKPEELPVVPVDFADRGAKYAGTYKSWRSNFTTLQKVLVLLKGYNVSLASDNSLIIAGRKYAEIGNNLFKAIEPFKTGGLPEVIAFQENAAGEITGFVAEDLSYMSTYKAAWYENKIFNGFVFVLSFLIFIGTFLRGCYQRKAYKALSGPNKSARRSALIVSNINLATIVGLVFVIITTSSQIGLHLPMMFKAWLVLPMLVCALTIYQMLKTIHVWSRSLLGGIAERIRFTFVTLAAVFMCWFYWFWNLLGYHYIS